MNATKEEKELGFIDHLEELRTRLIRGFIAMIIVALGCAYFADLIVNDILLKPLKDASPEAKLQNLVPYGQVTLYLQSVLFSSFILSFPILFYQVWQFILPGLLPKERKAARFVVLFISICFFLGVSFGYFIALPISLRFFASFGSSQIENNIAVGEYMSFFVGTMLTTGLIFELPFVSYVMSKIGILTPAFMRHYRRHSILGIFVIAAIVTPSTDAVTMLVIALPMILLYEVSIFISGYIQRKREREERDDFLSTQP